MASKLNTLFTPLRVGNATLSHRAVMAPLTRFRSTPKGHVPLPMVAEYYGQRSSTPGTLLITEATLIAPEAGGYDAVPGIWSEDQIKAWQKVVERVHNNGSYIFLQLWALGRAADHKVLAEDGYPYLSASPVPLSGHEGELREMTKDEIDKFVGLYAQAAQNAIFKAGFDGVEIHGANGYLIDQFLQDVSNKRTDEYGGSVENRSRFGLEVVKAVVDKVGAERTAIRLSPFSVFQDMKMKDPHPQFAHFVSALATQFPELAHIHVIEGRYDGLNDVEGEKIEESLNFLREIWEKTGKAFLSAGGYTREKALEHFAKGKNASDAVVFGRWFISNPDLPKRLRENIKLNPYDRSTFYKAGSPEGYVDYPFAA